MTLLHQTLSANAARHPGKPALIYAHQGAWTTLTYRQLVERSDHLAGGLAALGIAPGTRAALMTPPGPDFFPLAFALLQSGIVPVIVDPAIGFANVRACLDEARPQVYLGSLLTHAVRRLFGWGRASLRLNLSLADVQRAARSAPARPPLDLGPQSEAAVIYTSGSTGTPKGAIYTQANLAAQVEMLAATFGLTGAEIDLPAFPIFALIDCLVGASAIIPDLRFPSARRIDPRRVLAAIREQRVDTLFASPTALDRLARYAAPRHLSLDGLERVITAGAPAPVSVLESFRRLLPPAAGLFGVYGATEVLPISVVESREILDETRYLTERGGGVCIGRPVAGSEVYILAIHDQPVELWDEALALPPGEVGEITVGGPAVTAAYVGRPAANRLAKIPTPGGQILHRSGDLGYFDRQGRLWYCGRKAHRVVTPEGTLFTEMIEGIFNAHPQVYRTALVGVPRGERNQVVLWIELQPAARGVDRANLCRELRALASGHPGARQVERFLFHPGFPTDVRHNSKIIREELARLAAARKDGYAPS